MKNASLLKVLSMVALGVSAQATPITINFLENGSNLSLGSSSVFTESGVSLTAYASSGQNLYAKSAGSGETGLGIASDSDHEINSGNFIQLYSSSSGLSLSSLFLSSVQEDESATIWFSSQLGSLGSKIGTVYSDGSFNVSAYVNGYIGVSAGGECGNVLIATATGSTSTLSPRVDPVPDSGSTLILLGGVLTGLSLIKRKFLA